jgi:peptidoglycan hydrolase CwlO-like protein
METWLAVGYLLVALVFVFAISVFKYAQTVYDLTNNAQGRIDNLYQYTQLHERQISRLQDDVEKVRHS